MQLVRENPSEALFPRRDVFYDDLPSHHFDADLYVLSHEDLLERRNRLGIEETKGSYAAEKQAASRKIRRSQRTEKDVAETNSSRQPLSESVERRHKPDERQRGDKRRSKSIDNPNKISAKIPENLHRTENVPKRRSRSVSDDKKDKTVKRSSGPPAELRELSDEKHRSGSIDNPSKTSAENPESLMADQTVNLSRRMPKSTFVDNDEVSNKTLPPTGSSAPLWQQPESIDNLSSQKEGRNPNARHMGGLFSFESKGLPKRRQSISVDHTIRNNSNEKRRGEDSDGIVHEFHNVQETSVATFNKKFRRRGSLASAFSFRMKRSSPLPQRQGGNRRSTNENNTEVGIPRALLSKQRSMKNLLDVGMHDKKTTTHTPMRRMSMDTGSARNAAPVQARRQSVSCLQLTFTGEAVMATITSPDFTTL